ncbi:MAG: HlyD family secretion protein [Chlorobiales bacterium]|nr:HlyD family secretion protein [Chlorobiales bacterium]
MESKPAKTESLDTNGKTESGLTSGQPPKEQGQKKKIVRIAILSIVLLGAAVWGTKTYLAYLHYEDTDDAQIEGNIYPVLPRVSGQVSEVLVRDNQSIDKGEVLVRLDPSDYEVKRDMAVATLESAKAALKAAEANASVASANISTAKANIDKAQLDLARSTNLRKQDVIAQADFDAVKAKADALSSEYLAAKNQYQAALSQVPLKQADVKNREAELRNADLLLSYTVIKAPAPGIVSKKNVQVGQFVQSGQSLMAITGKEETDYWVVANFKETQLEHIKVDQPVEITVDAYPDIEFKGAVQSIGAATGAKFSLLPPDNASGNFVKVSQRVPVKIVLTEKPNKDFPLKPGLNVVAAIKVK